MVSRRAGPRTDDTRDISVASWVKLATPKLLTRGTHNRRQGYIEKYRVVTADEVAEFDGAWQKGQAGPIDDRFYASDLAPLSGEPQHKLLCVFPA